MTVSLTSTSAGCSMANAADVSPDVASFMADSQVLSGVEALSGAIHPAVVENKAKLAPRDDRRQDDPA
jgi:hypothetical protein